MSENGTKVSLRDFIEQQITSLRGEIRNVELRTDAKLLVNEAQKKADLASLNERLTQMNEFRLQLSEERGSYFTKSEQALFANSIEKEIESLRLVNAQVAGVRYEKSDQRLTLGYVMIPLIAIAVAVVAVVISLLK